MKRLLYFLVVIYPYKAMSQVFPVRNVNDEYIVSSLKGSEQYKNIKEVIRDKNGLYWFHNLTNVSSFDGINWRAYEFKDANGRRVPVRINEIEVTDDSTIWLATAEGIFGFNPRTEKFVPIRQIFPHLTGMPSITNCIYKGVDNFLFVSLINEGVYIFDWNKGRVKHVVIDSSDKTNLETNGIELYVTIDKQGNYWGLTKENRGIWFYNPSTGEIKRSWKGEIFPASAKRLDNVVLKSITYSPGENALLLSYGPRGILEKLFLSTGRSKFYCFSGELNVHPDTNSRNKLAILRVKVDRQGNEWVLAEGGILVKLDPDITKCEYLKADNVLLPLGKIDWLVPEANMKSQQHDEGYLLWMLGEKGVTVLRKRNGRVRQIPFEKVSKGGITPDDYINRDVTREITPFSNIHFLNGPGGTYLLLQQNPGRPKLLKFDRQFRITDSLFHVNWRDHPAYFNASPGSEIIHIAILRPGEEPLDFRKVVVKDYRVNTRNMKVEELDLSFSERVSHYGSADAENISWLFSNGYLYSYEPRKDKLDSIFICKPLSKKPYSNSRIKGYDFPAVLHKNTATFWISFISDKELYKIDLKKRRIARIIKTSLEEKGALPTGVYQLHGFDSSRIYLKLNLTAALLNPANDSITFYSDLFISKLPYEDHVGSMVYKDWLCSATQSEVNLQNTVTGKQKRLLLGQDFKWKLSTLFSVPPVNERGEIVLMSSTQRGFIVFNPDSIPFPSAPGIVQVSSIRLNEKNLLLDSVLEAGVLRLKYNKYRSVHFRFSDQSVIDQDKIKYEFSLYNGGDTIWTPITGDPEINFAKIYPGRYRLLLRAANGFGDYSPKITSFQISIVPIFTQTAWFIVVLVLAVALILYGLYRYRLQQVKRIQIIRNNIASDLHDDIGSTLNSISIYSEVAKQQAGKSLPALELIGDNSRKIIENMSDIVWTINPENDSFEKIIVRMRSFAYQLLKAKQVEFTFEADEKLNRLSFPMQVRKNFYLVFKEAVNNIVKYSGASRVKISLFEEMGNVILQIQDNGKGIPVNAESLGNGLMNMKRRAKEISGNLIINSDTNTGTGIEFSVRI